MTGESFNSRPKKVLHLKEPPKSREVYWIQSPDGAKPPEFTGCHPGIIIRGASGLNDLSDTVVFIPITSREPPKDEFGNYTPKAVKLSKNPHPDDNRQVWAIVEQLHTARLSRVRLYKTEMGYSIPKLGRDDFNAVMDNMIGCQGSLRMHIERRVQKEVDAVKSDYEQKLADLAQKELELESRFKRMEARLLRKQEMTANLRERVLAVKEAEPEEAVFRM